MINPKQTPQNKCSNVFLFLQIHNLEEVSSVHLQKDCYQVWIPETMFTLSAKIGLTIKIVSNSHPCKINKGHALPFYPPFLKSEYTSYSTLYCLKFHPHMQVKILLANSAGLSHVQLKLCKVEISWHSHCSSLFITLALMWNYKSMVFLSFCAHIVSSQIANMKNKSYNTWTGSKRVILRSVFGFGLLSLLLEFILT